MSTQACNLTLLYVIDYFTASRFVLTRQICSALVVPKCLRLAHGHYTAETTVYHSSLFLGCEYSDFCRRIHDVS